MALTPAEKSRRFRERRRRERIELIELRAQLVSNEPTGGRDVSANVSSERAGARAIPLLAALLAFIDADDNLVIRDGGKPFMKPTREQRAAVDAARQLVAEHRDGRS